MTKKLMYGSTFVPSTELVIYVHLCIILWNLSDSRVRFRTQNCQNNRQVTSVSWWKKVYTKTVLNIGNCTNIYDIQSSGNNSRLSLSFCNIRFLSFYQLLWISHIWLLIQRTVRWWRKAWVISSCIGIGKYTVKPPQPRENCQPFTNSASSCPQLDSNLHGRGV